MCIMQLLEIGKFVIYVSVDINNKQGTEVTVQNGNIKSY